MLSTLQGMAYTIIIYITKKTLSALKVLRLCEFVFLAIPFDYALQVPTERFL